MSDPVQSIETTTPDTIPGPNHRDLYVLAAGVLLGILLGPMVLGAISPGTYAKYFASVEEATTNLVAYDVDTRHQLQVFESTGVTSTALTEMQAARSPERQLLLTALSQARHNEGRLIAVLLAVVMVMVIETLPSPSSLLTRQRLATARYGLIALGLALVLAQPSIMQGLPVLFLGLIVIAALAMALIPLGPAPKA